MHKATSASGSDASIATSFPRWAGELATDSDHFALISASRPNIAQTDGDGVEAAAFDAYLELADRLNDRHAIRIWNFVPRIVDPAGNGLDRYMRFNAGRRRAFARWFNGRPGWEENLPSASAVSHAGSELVVHALISRQPAKAISNPRQKEPYRYSPRFGPIPPCFSRATLFSDQKGKRLLAVGGTASVRGEESVHVENLDRQLDETFANLASLVQTAFGGQTSARPLRHFRELRVYYPHSHALSIIEAAVAAQFPLLNRGEWLMADLCRANLMVEIEGLACENR